MSNAVEKVFLKLTSAIAVNGIILRAGHIVEMVEDEAKDLLRRGKAVIATVEDEVKAVVLPKPADHSTPVPAAPSPAPAPAPVPAADGGDGGDGAAPAAGKGKAK
jgi:hypothetical protein